MSTPKTITIDGVDFVRADSIQPKPDGDRHIVILDRGFIFEGVLSEDDGVYTLTDCANIRRWERGGTGGMLKSAGKSGASLDDSADIKWSKGSEHFMAATPIGWRNE